MKVIDRYQLEEVVGSGTYGKVYKSRMIDTNELFAIKCIPVEKFRKIKKLSEFTQNEIEVLEKIKHPNIVRFYEKLVTVNNTYMVYEFCNGGTLESGSNCLLPTICETDFHARVHRGGRPCGPSATWQRRLAVRGQQPVADAAPDVWQCLWVPVALDRNACRVSRLRPL